MNKLIIIDGHNFLWRSFSVPFKFYSKKDTPLHVLSTYLRLIRRTVTSINKVDAAVVVFDTDTKNDNSKLLKEYKANRRKFSKDEDSPYAHLPYVRKALKLLNIEFLEIPNIEADDIMASISKGFCKKDPKNQAYIVSSDTDFYQLLNKQTFILKLKKKDDYEIIRFKDIKNKLGINPRQYVKFKSLTGDSADNIKGIYGVGPVMAKKIICKDVDFDIKEHQEMLDLNQKLIKLNCDCKKQWRYRDFSYKEYIMDVSNQEIFNCCEF